MSTILMLISVITKASNLAAYFQASGAECTRGCVFSPDGLCVLLNSDDNKVRLYELPKEDEVKLMPEFIHRHLNINNRYSHLELGCTSVTDAKSGLL